MSKDDAFKEAGHRDGLEIWRIKSFHLEVVPAVEHGKFFGGDSYIVLYTYMNGSRHNVHVWLGEETTPDEAGTAAIKMVELDDSLGGGPVQYREVQNHESNLFLSYFKKGIRCLQGGYTSGFRKVDLDAVEEPRLFHVKGKLIVRVQQVNLTLESLNKGDAFILDTGKKLFCWFPPDCNGFERLKGQEQARNIRDEERSGKPEIEVVDSDWDSNPEFWSFFGGKGPISPASAAGLDDQLPPVPLSLWRVTDASGELKIEKVAEKNLQLSMLDTNDAFILDSQDGVFTWIGKGCTKNERKNALQWAASYLEQENRPSWVQSVRVLEGNETSQFLQWFSANPTAKKMSSVQQPPQITAPPTLFACSVAQLKEIQDFEQKDLNSKTAMILDTGNEVFLWLGKETNEAERENGKTLAKEHSISGLTSRPNNAEVAVVEEGEEPERFQAFFSNWN